MIKRIDERVAELSTDNLTVKLLNALDFAVPGQWSNTTSFFDLIQKTTGEDVPAVLAQIHTRAIEIEAQKQGYQQALKVFEMIDTIDQVAAGAVLAGKVTDLFGGLDFLKKFTPKPETTQAIDAALKLVAELVAFGLMHGMPQMNFDGLARFVIALQDYARYDLMRIAAWVIVDGMMPLGPNFLAKIVETTSSVASEHLTGHSAFKNISDKLPGDTVEEKRTFIVKAVEQTGEWVTGFVEEKGLTHDIVQEKIISSIGLAEGGLDYLAAALDASTDYFTHTGTQTVARALIKDAYASVKDDVWADYVTGLR